MISTDRRRTAGWALIVIGVLAWAPFLVMAAGGRRPSIIPFLAAHLLGVLVGGWLRASADRLDGIETKIGARGRKRRIVSRILIYLGVLAWAPYFYLENVAGQDMEVAPFLAAHLAGVVGGAILRASVELDKYISR